jgi:hypothetical protein
LGSTSSALLIRWAAVASNSVTVPVYISGRPSSPARAARERSP